MQEFGFTDTPFVCISALLGQYPVFLFACFYSLMAVKSKVLFSFLSAVGAYQLTGMAGINDDYNTLYKGSAEKKSKLVSQARKGKLEGKERVTGS